MYGPGHNSGAALPTGDGTQKSYITAHGNLSGVDINVCSIVLQGWSMRTTGTSDVTNTFTVNGTIEYPTGTVLGTIPDTVVTMGGNVETADITLSAPIPPGATMRISLFSTVPNGLKYIANLGFAGLRVHTTRSDLLPKVVLFGVGDSIMTNNNGVVSNATNTRCPCYHNSISGTRAEHYGANSAEFFQRQVDLAKKLGVTHFISNFGTNDFGAGTSLATLQGYLLAMKAAANANGVQFVQATMLPRTLRITSVTASAVTSSGNTMTCTVPDTTNFVVGKPYTIAGATPTEYNGSKICVAKDATTVSFLFQGSATTPATGTITIDSWKATFQHEWMREFSPEFLPGASSPRGQFNAWVRGGALDGYVEWADAVESARDSGIWKTVGGSDLLPDVQLVTLSSVISTSRFNSNYNRGSSTMANGFLQAATGANTGYQRQANNNTNGDITASSTWPNAQAVGDTVYAVPGVSYISDDGTHPRVAGGSKGGQPHLDNAMAAWIDARL
jgi:hypothetical protein